MSDRTKNPLQPSDDSTHKKEVPGSSPTRKGRIPDLDAWTRMKADNQPGSSGDTPGSTGIASNTFEIINAASINNNLIEGANKANKGIEEKHVKYEKSHTVHIEKSKAEILATAQIALDRVPQGQPKKALLLGVGHSFDIPLKELTERFDYVTVVELDRESTTKAIRRLSPELQKKVRFVVADITGISSRYIDEVKERLRQSRTIKYFHKSTVEITNNMAVESIGKSYDVGKDYTFVCSHLVLSQLGNTARAYIENAVRIKFPVQIQNEDNKRMWNEFFHGNGPGGKLMENLQKEHILYLARSVTPSGRIHFADTSQWTDTQLKKSHFTFNEEVIDSVINESFLPPEKVTWPFQEQPGKLEYKVSSYSLSKKELEQPSLVPPERSGAETLPDVPQDTVKKKKKKKKKSEGNLGQTSSTPPEPAGLKTPPGGKQQMQAILQHSSGPEQLKNLFQEEDTGDKDKQPSSASPKQSGAETPPDVRQELTDILADPSKRERIKQLLVERRAREAIDGSKIKEPQDMTNDHERKIDDLQRANELLQGQVKLLGDQNELLQGQVKLLGDQVEQLIWSRGEAINAVKEELTRSFSDLIGRIQAIADRPDDE